MYTDLICPTCGELAPRIESQVKIIDLFPGADKYFCKDCNTTWHLVIVAKLSPIIFDFDKFDSKKDVLSWLKEEIDRKRKEEEY
jgi:acetone carboxylase gamma subunit